MKHLIHLVAAARPNFMKIAPLYHVLRREPHLESVIVHTGQHYDVDMSEVFFRDLGLPSPHVHLGVGSGTHAAQTAQVMQIYEQVLLAQRPELVIVVGDVNSTLACTLAAVKLWYRPAAGSGRNGTARPLVAHLEAGLRSFDRSMPEEINRLLTDAVADVLWTPSPDADENLRREGISEARIVRVGNIMIDSFELLRDRIEADATWQRLGLRERGYGVVTLHRPSNVDDAERLSRWVEVLQRLAKRLPLVFPVHPRTRKQLAACGLLERLAAAAPALRLLEPLSYIAFMNLVCHARLAITDSGGLQEETTYLGIPCLTLRPNTERPITITQGTNRLCDIDNIETRFEEVLATAGAAGAARRIPDLWDGRTAKRVLDSIRRLLRMEETIAV